MNTIYLLYYYLETNIYIFISIYIQIYIFIFIYISNTYFSCDSQRIRGHGVSTCKII